MHSICAPTRSTVCAAAVAATILSSASASAITDRQVNPEPRAAADSAERALWSRLRVGDLVFIRVGARPFREVASATGSWTNHVGIVVDTSGHEPLIGESTFPFSRFTPLSRFVSRSENRRVAVARLDKGLTPGQQRALRRAAMSRTGILYDTGFNLHSHRQFCSKYVQEVVLESTGVAVAPIESFRTLLLRRPVTDLAFWKLWYFGSIPWNRETVTPAALLESTNVRLVFDGGVPERQKHV